jgi:hypothetical protein
MTRGSLVQHHQEHPLLFPDDEPPQRIVLVAHWLELTRERLPGLAEPCRWPISQDHCFMRVCLDTALGAPWHSIIQRPAIRHLTIAQLEAAIAVAEAVIAAPETLEALNRQSIRWRQEQP